MFEKIPVKALPYKAKQLPSKPSGDFNLPALTAGIQNQGLNNFVPREEVMILKNVISISANGANTGATFYQDKEFTVLQDAYAIKWKKEEDILKREHYLYLVACISKTIYGNFEWTRKAGWERVKKEMIQLPTENKAINFDFMESFIAELEAQRISELEAYLVATGLKDYQLNNQEVSAVTLLQENKIEFQPFKVVDIFNVKNTYNILSRDIVENSGRTPYLSAGRDNNSVSSYIAYDTKYLDRGNCIFIGGKTFVVTYQNQDFFSNDSHNLCLYLKDKKSATKMNQLFMISCIEKGLKHQYSWGNSISNRKIQKDVILLPVKDNLPDFEYMQTLINAVQKLVIKDVVEYSNNKLRAYDKVVNKY